MSSNSSWFKKLVPESPTSAENGAAPSLLLYRIAGTEMTLFYLYSAYVQLNDPDYHVWYETVL
jgi:hypothetical protein